MGHSYGWPEPALALDLLDGQLPRELLPIRIGVR
jgi:hypothetical protein